MKTKTDPLTGTWTSAQESDAQPDEKLREGAMDAAEHLIKRAREQMERVRLGELPLHLAAAELGLMPSELEVLAGQSGKS